MRVSNSVVFSAGDMSGTLTSAAIPLFNIFGWSAQFTYTGSPVGTLKVQVSCDPDPQGGPQVPLPTHWTDLANSSVSISAAGDSTYNVDLSFYNWIRFIYTFSSGTGALSGRVNLKGI